MKSKLTSGILALLFSLCSSRLAWASCERYLSRTGTSSLENVLYMLCDIPGLVMAAALWFSAMLAILIGLIRRTPNYYNWIVSLTALAGFLFFSRLFLSSWYFCETYTVQLLLRNVFDNFMAMFMGTIFFILPCLWVGSFLADSLSNALENRMPNYITISQKYSLARKLMLFGIISSVLLTFPYAPQFAGCLCLVATVLVGSTYALKSESPEGLSKATFWEVSQLVAVAFIFSASSLLFLAHV